MNIINATPHSISLADTDGNVVRTYEASGLKVRVSTTTTEVASIAGFSGKKVTFGAVEGIPAPDGTTMYLVSSLVAQALTGVRDDVVAPDTGPAAVREGGQVKAVRSFQRFQPLERW
jgi:hypothetical protein